MEDERWKEMDKVVISAACFDIFPLRIKATVPKLEVGNLQQIGGHHDMEATCGGWRAWILV